MTKLRIMCKPSEIAPTMESIRKVFKVVSASGAYACRQSEYVRMYVEVEGKEECGEGNARAE